MWGSVRGKTVVWQKWRQWQPARRQHGVARSVAKPGVVQITVAGNIGRWCGSGGSKRQAEMPAAAEGNSAGVCGGAAGVGKPGKANQVAKGQVACVAAAATRRVVRRAQNQQGKARNGRQDNEGARQRYVRVNQPAQVNGPNQRSR